MRMPSLPRPQPEGLLLLILLGAGCAGSPMPVAQAAPPPAGIAEEAQEIGAATPAAVDPEPVMLLPDPVPAAPVPAAVAPEIPIPAAVAPAIPVPAATAPEVAALPIAVPAPTEAPVEPQPVPAVAMTPEPAVVQSAPAPAAPTTPPLDIAALTTRLRETDAIGMFTKLALKNQVDDLLKQVRVHYQAGNGSDIATLRQPYNMLILKVLALVQDSDPSLARTIAGSREAIWGILADPVKFNAMS